MLWNKHNGKIKISKQEARQAAWLWRRVRQPQEAVVLGRAGQHPDILPARELGEISDAVRLELELSEQDVRDAQDAFAAVHARLMQAITESPAETNSSTAGPATRPWMRRNNIRSWFTPSAVLRHGPALQWVTTFLLVAIVGIGAHHAGQAGAGPVLPVQSLVDDYEAGLRSPKPFELVADETQNPKEIAKQWSRHIGIKVRVPAPQRTGLKLLGARRHYLWDRPVAQTHYLKDNVRVALYQIHETRCGLNGLDEVDVGGKVFLTGNRGAYRVVAWRADDNVMTMVSPLAMHESLQLAKAVRDSNEEQRYSELVSY